MADVTLYSRKNCSPCSAASGWLKTLAEKYAFEYEVVDVDEDPLNERRYGGRVPVVSTSHEELLDSPFSERRLGDLMRQRFLPRKD